jgi:CheY-like chemotaxis protein
VAAKSITVLLVEDNESHAKLVIRSFEEHQVSSRVFHLRDGEAVVNYLTRAGQYTAPQNSPRPDLVLLDLRLPKIDGLEVLRIIKEHEDLRELPVVILTTSDAENDITRAYNLRANSYLVKPVDFDAFSKMMRDLAFYWLVWNQSPNVSNN